jgi:hypothetical protein
MLICPTISCKKKNLWSENTTGFYISQILNIAA